MSWLSLPDRPGHPADVALIVQPTSKDLGGFSVRRALPSASRRMVGPFVFLDHMGPALMPPGHGIDVRPHPHIGLATLTYLTDGSFVHRDSLGTEQPIQPGDVNWMTAGRGIAHSERTGSQTRLAEHRIQGIQSWVALPSALEETDPAFYHHPVAALPRLTDTGISVRLIIGALYGQHSPVHALSPMFYADVALAEGASVPLPPDYAERAIYVLDGAIEIGGVAHGAHQLLLLRPDDPITLRATQPTRLLMLGGEPLDGPRHVWWNFVSSRPERIEAAKDDWRAGRFGGIAGDDEFIPLSPQ